MKTPIHLTTRGLHENEAPYYVSQDRTINLTSEMMIEKSADQALVKRRLVPETKYAKITPYTDHHQMTESFKSSDSHTNLLN
jgi:hypothetical protein